MQTLAQYKLNPFCRIRLENPLIVDLCLEGREYELSSPKLLSLFAQLAQPAEGRDVIATMESSLKVDRVAAEQLLHDLLDKRILVEGEFAYPCQDGIDHWIRRGWLDALFLHLKTQSMAFDDDLSPDPDQHVRKVFADLVQREPVPELWKQVSASVVVPLNPDAVLPDRPLDEVLLARRSHTAWRGGLRADELSAILRSANAELVRLRRTCEAELADDPSVLLNSAFSPHESYVFAFDVAGVPSGIYHYDPRHHALALMREGSFRADISRLCIGQQRPGEAGCAILVTAVWKRYMYRYRHSRAYRTLLINSGEFVQKYLVAAAAFGLGTFMTPAFEDHVAEELLGFSGADEAPIYSVAFG